MWTPRPVSELRIAASGADEGLALAGPHLGDAALVEDGRPDDWTSNVAHPERPLHGLAGHREDLGQDVVEGLLEASFSRLRRALRSSRRRSRSGWCQLVLGRLTGLGELADLVADLGELGADLLVGQAPRTRLRGAFASSTTGWMRRTSRSFESTKRERNCMGAEV